MRYVALCRDITQEDEAPEQTITLQVCFWDSM